MAMIPPTSSSNFKLIEAGNYVARCIGAVVTGTFEQEFKGEKKKMKKIRIFFELPTEIIQHETRGSVPMMINKEYTYSYADKANLRKDLETWRGKKFDENDLKTFDIEKVVGVQCQLNIMPNEKQTYNTITSITPVMKGVLVPKQECQSFIYNIDDHQDAQFDALPDWIKEIVKKSEEWVSVLQNRVPGVASTINEDEENCNVDPLPF